MPFKDKYMNKQSFKTFLIEAGRSQEITKEHFEDWTHKHCPKYLSNLNNTGAIIYRGVRNTNNYQNPRVNPLPSDGGYKREI